MSTSVSGVLDAETERLLLEGKAAARRGDKVMARALLGQVVEREPRVEEAWMWLSGVVADPQEQQICLENVLVVNPYNEQARKGLDYISTKTGILPRVPPAPPQPQLDAPAMDFSLPVDDSDEAPPWVRNGSVHNGQQDAGGAQPQPAGPPAQPAGPAEGAPIQASSTSSLEMAAQPGMQTAGVDGELEPSAQAFIPPIDSTQSSYSLTDGQRADAKLQSSPKLEAPAWLDQIAPQPQPEPEPSAPAQDMSQYAGPVAPTLADAPPAAIDMSRNRSPMGPFTDLHLPSPEELPGSNGHAMHQPQQTQQAQPWYLQSSGGGAVGGPPTSGGQDYSQGESYAQQKVVPTMECPNCKEQVPETSLACPNCRFQFFVNCPHCHELVDAGTAKPGVTEPCPYCGTIIDKMQLGLSESHGAIPYESVPLKDAPIAYPEMQQFTPGEPAAHNGFSFSWVVDLLWLATIIAVIWVLTQLPVWLRLTGQY